MGCSLNVSAENMQIKISPEQINNLAIKVGPLVASHHVPLLYVPARVVVPSNHEQLVSAAQPGFLTQLHANIGDKVAKGQILAQIHSPELVALQQQYLTARSELNLVSLEQSRDKKLLQEGVIAQRRWQQTQALHNSKAAVADEARQLLSIAGMSAGEINALAKTHKLTSLLNVRAPVDGVVLDRMVTLGSRLDMQAPLYRIADLSELWLEINIPQERMQNLQLGDLVKVENSDISAKISLLGQSVNRENQTMLARAVILGKTDQLRVGQNLNVQIMQDAGETGFRVPNSAIAQNTGHSYVFVRNAEGFKVTEVTVVGKQDLDSLISGPISADAQIAMQGAVALKANWLGLGGDE
jgi:cobalt-zinc-cadmium efflux system membrane fusion protein